MNFQLPGAAASGGKGWAAHIGVGRWFGQVGCLCPETSNNLSSSKILDLRRPRSARKASLPVP